MNDSSIDQLYLSHVKTLMQRTDKALAAAGYDALVLCAGAPPVLFLDDQDYPFKVNPHFKAWVPIVDNPRCILIYVPGQKPRVLFYQPNDFWHKPATLPQGTWTTALDWQVMADDAKASEQWAHLGRVAVIGPGSENPQDLLARLHFDRAVKTEYELACMRRASELGALGHLAAVAQFRQGRSEFEAQMAYLSACVQREEEMPYNNIVAYNENAAVLHYQHLERKAPHRLRSFLIDAGAQFRGYAADITRTYAAHSGLFAEFISAMDEAQRKLCAQIISGRDYRDVHLAAHRLLGEVMHAMKLISLPGQDALEAGITRVFFPHGIGHLLGLQVHDVGGVMADMAGHEHSRPAGHPTLRLTRMLEPGVVVTVEPGIYMIDSLLAQAHADARRAHINWAMVEELKPYGGIRIEDNVVATATAPENMTRDAFARVAERNRDAA